MNGDDRNMFWKGHRLQSVSVILLSITLLTMIDLVSMSTPRGERTSCKSLRKGVKLTKLINMTTSDLIKTYQLMQGDFAEQFCKMSLNSVPSSSISGETTSDRMFNIYTRLKEFLPHTKKVLEQQKDLQPPQCPLLSELAQVTHQTTHLINKVNSILQILEPNIPIFEPPALPTGIPMPQNVFQQKVYGCVVLTRLNEFLSNVVDELKLLKDIMCTKKQKGN